MTPAVSFKGQRQRAPQPTAQSAYVAKEVDSQIAPQKPPLRVRNPVAYT